MTVLIPDARLAMFGALIDYAGLFPPTSRDMESAVAGYRAARSSDEAWIAGRFLCPASRLQELAGVLVRTMEPGEAPWRVSVVFDADDSATEAAAFHNEMEPAATVDLVEARIPPGAGDEEGTAVFATAATVHEGVVPFLEVPRDGAVPATITRIAGTIGNTGRAGGAKLRCGGLTADAFPSTHEVAEFIIECTEAGIPFKTTAGLHHAIRHHDEELNVMRHGFLNVLTAAIAAHAGAGLLTIEAIIADTDPEAFEVGFAGVEWRGERVGASAIDETRSAGFIAYGSCEFEEPVEDLAGLGFLP